MRIAISNIAWDLLEDQKISNLLRHFDIDAIDIAPGKYFPVPEKTTDEEITYIRKWWNERGIEITGMQSLLFGTAGLNIFGSLESQAIMFKHLASQCRIAKGLGATRLVFGSPKNRDCTGLSDQDTMNIAIPFFQHLGDIAKNYGVVICLEPNPLCYGATFMINSVETAQVVRAVAHPAIKMQVDMGALTINREDPDVIVGNFADILGHIHASEPNLVPLGDGGTDHHKMAAVIKRYLPNYIVSIEMLATQHEPHEVSIERALNVAIRHYRK